MAKNRTIPFGYTMMCGRIVIEPSEANAVVRIFSEYINGMSLLNIARLMEQQNIRYTEYSAHWNKNMVKRIIENEKYIGAMDYPQIIDADTFCKTNMQKSVRCTVANNIPDDIIEIRERTYCAECGHRLIRKGGNGRYERWDCSNPDCRPLSYRLTDNMLKGAVVLALNTVTANPEILDSTLKVSSYSPTAEIRRQENELSHMKEMMQADRERIKDELFKLVQMKYDCCEYNDKFFKTAELSELLSERGQLNNFDIDLFRACVSRIWIGHFYTAEIELINGMKIKNNTEWSDDNDDCGKCNHNTAEGTADGKP